MARPRVLTPDNIIDAAAAIVRDVGADRLTVRALGARLGVDPTSMYHHFRTMDDVRRALGDRLLGDVTLTFDAQADWATCVRQLCQEVRRAQLGRPDLAVLVRSGPTRLPNELRITETLLAQLSRAGLAPTHAASAYHALIELTVGSAAIDATLVVARGETADDVYAGWRNDYAQLDPETHPHSVATAPHLYRGDADDRFDEALDLLLCGISAAVSGRSASR